MNQELSSVSLPEPTTDELFGPWRPYPKINLLDLSGVPEECCDEINGCQRILLRYAKRTGLLELIDPVPNSGDQVLNDNLATQSTLPASDHLSGKPWSTKVTSKGKQKGPGRYRGNNGLA